MLAFKRDELLQGGKTARMEQRITIEAKLLIEQAAALLGINGAEFTTHAAVKAAREVIRDYQKTTLTLADQEAFARAIDNLDPTDALIELMRGA